MSALRRRKKGTSLLLVSGGDFHGRGYEDGMGYVRCGMGRMSRLMGRFNEVRRYYYQANMIFRHRRNFYGLACSCCGLGGRHDAVSQPLRKAEQEYAQIGPIFGG